MNGNKAISIIIIIIIINVVTVSMNIVKLDTLPVSPPSIIRIMKLKRMRWAGHVARMMEKRNTYRLWMGKPEGKRPVGRPRRTWVANIRMDL
jgi:hypothetical protein